MDYLPRGWTSTTFGQATEMQLGKMLDRANNLHGAMLPYLRNINVRWGQFDTEDLATMRFTVGEQEKFSVRDGDVLVCEGGEPGRAAVWRGGSTSLLFQKAIHRLRPRSAVLPDWCALYLRHVATTGDLTNHLTGTTIKHLPAQALGALGLPLPPLPEQRRIVARIEALFARTRRARADLERIAPLAGRYHDTVLEAAAKGQHPYAARPSATGEQPLASIRRVAWSEGYERRALALGRSLPNGWRERYRPPVVPPPSPEWLPDGWDWVSLDSLAWDAGYGTSEKCEVTWSGTPVLRIPNIAYGQLNMRDLKFSRAELPGVIADGVQPGDLLIVRTNGSRDLIGRGAVAFDRAAKPIHYASYLIRFRLLPDASLWRWVSMLWKSPLIRSQVLDHAASSAGQYNISLTELSSFGVALPPHSVRAEIVDEVDRILAGAAVVERNSARSLTLIDHLEQSILARAFRGELVPQDPADEPVHLRPTTSESSTPPPAPRRRGRPPGQARAAQ